VYNHNNGQQREQRTFGQGGALTSFSFPPPPLVHISYRDVDFPFENVFVLFLHWVFQTPS
jgi:hypothetical protein